jgi:hypothetical protein
MLALEDIQALFLCAPELFLKRKPPTILDLGFPNAVHTLEPEMEPVPV